MTPKEATERFPEFLTAFENAANPHNGKLVAIVPLPNTDDYSLQAEAYGRRAARAFKREELEMERGSTASTTMQLEQLFYDLKTAVL